MFTGIVREVGRVESVQAVLVGGCTLRVGFGTGTGDDDDYERIIRINEGELGYECQVKIGDSVAVNGVCLTVADVQGNLACLDVSPETHDRCLIGEWRAGKRVNIEPAPTIRTPLGGHLVSGHIDGVGEVVARATDGRFTRLDFEAPSAIGKLIAHKGSLAIDGVSLTTNEVRDIAGQTRFSAMLVPHTLMATNFNELQTGARVHIEVDALARYVQRLMESGAGNKWPTVV